jgi:very-short-patch-repair endonuclease
VDLAYPSARLALEADGYRYHSRRSQWQRDLRRRNELAAAGWTVLHFTWEDVRSGRRETVARVAAALGSERWTLSHRRGG